MATTYYQRDTNRAVGYDATAFEKALETATATAASLSTSIAALGSAEWVFTAATGPGVLDWTTPGFGIGFDVTALGATTTFLVIIRRISADFATHLTNQTVASGQTGTGLKTYTVDFTNANGPAGRAITDTVAISFNASNGNMMSAETTTLQVNTVNSYLTVPWDLGPKLAPRPFTKLQAVNRASTY
jgi:hypothetical protein